jgi:hypothetical protein
MLHNEGHLLVEEEKKKQILISFQHGEVFRFGWSITTPGHYQWCVLMYTKGSQASPKNVPIKITQHLLSLCVEFIINKFIHCAPGLRGWKFDIYKSEVYIHFGWSH